MKKISLVLFTVLMVFHFAKAQRSKTWLELGLKGGGGISVLVNKNVWDDKKTAAPSLSPCFSYGGKLALNFNESHQLAFEGIWGTRSQQYEFLFDKVTYDKLIKLNVNDLAMFYRFNSSNGGFVELGGQYTMIKKATETTDNGSNEITNYFTNYTSAALGFGGNLIQSGSLTWTIGVRFSYSFTDAISADGGANEDYTYPLNDAVMRKAYPSYKATKPITAQLMTELNFDIGYLTKSNCKRGRVSFMSF
jgi:hypothetical protein